MIYPKSYSVTGASPKLAAIVARGAKASMLGLAALFTLSVPQSGAAFDPENPIPAVIPHGPLRVDLRPVVPNLISPALLTTAPDGSRRSFIVEQTGQIWIVQNGKRLPTPFLNVASRLVTLSANYDERGLLGLAFDPGFADQLSPGYRRVFTYTSEPVSGTADLADPYATSLNHHSVLASWRVSEADPNVIDVTSRQEIVRIAEPQSNHNGGHIEFGPDGYLYVGLGDGGGANDSNPNGHNPTTGNGQDADIALGKMLRIDVNGSNSANGKYGIPATNPFAADGGVKEIYALGFRNPYRFSFDGNQLLVADVGQNKIEEVNRVELGKNYGWRYKEGSFKFDQEGTVSDDLTGLPEGLTDPILQYDHDEGISIIGGYVYRGNAIPELKGKYVFGDFSRSFSSPTGRLFYADLETGEIREFILGSADQPLGLFIKGMGEDADGELFVLASTRLGPSADQSGNGAGIALKIVPAPLYTTGSVVPGAGVEGSGVPADATFSSFAAPSINDSGEIAFAAQYKFSSGKRTVVLGPKPSDRTAFGVIATSGSAAQDENGSPLGGGEVFASFKDPVLNNSGNVAFTAKLKGASKPLPASKDTGLWASASGSLRMLAREGSAAPGAGSATFKDFTSIALGDSAETESALAFVAVLAHSASSKTNASNDQGLWFSEDGDAPELLLREGQTVNIRESDRKIKSLKALTILPGAPGQGNGVAGQSVLALASFTDGTQAVLRASAPNEIAVVSATNDPAFDGTLKSFASVTQSATAKSAFIATLQGVTKATDTAVFIENLAPSHQLVAREGEQAPGTDAVFSSFPVVVRNTTDALFAARIAGNGATKANNLGLWWKRGDTMSLLARTGGTAPEVAGGVWQSFQSIALPEGPGAGPIILGKLRVAGAIKSRNNTGLWAAEADGELHLLLRTGSLVRVGSETKTLRTFTVLSVVPGSPAQTRSYNSNGELIYRAYFSDGSQAIQSVALP